MILCILIRKMYGLLVPNTLLPKIFWQGSCLKLHAECLVQLEKILVLAHANYEYKPVTCPYDKKENFKQ